MQKYTLILVMLCITASINTPQPILASQKPKPQVPQKITPIKPAQSQKHTAPPILQINSGGHMAKINDIFFTRDGKQLISASNDKTIGYGIFKPAKQFACCGDRLGQDMKVKFMQRHYRGIINGWRLGALWQKVMALMMIK